MPRPSRDCPDCTSAPVDRRTFLKTAGVAAGAITVASGLPVWAVAKDSAPATPESLVKQLYDTMSPEQRQQVCHAWDHVDPKRGLLRTFVANNWNINDHEILGDFYTDDQRDLIRAVFNGIIRPDWHKRFEKQLEDDAGGFGNNQSIAIFGEPGSGKFEFVMTGRHMTVRCDGDSAEHVAFGGPIFYGHAVQDEEEAQHPGNVFWEQAVEANKVFEMLDGKQREQALVEQRPREQSVAFRVARPSRQRDVEGSAGPTAKDADEAGRTVPADRPGRGARVLEGPGRAGKVRAGVLSRRRHRRRRRVGQLAAGRPLVRLVLPRRAPRSRVGERGQRPQRQAERLGLLEPRRHEGAKKT